MKDSLNDPASGTVGNHTNLLHLLERELTTIISGSRTNPAGLKSAIQSRIETIDPEQQLFRSFDALLPSVERLGPGLESSIEEYLMWQLSIAYLKDINETLRQQESAQAKPGQATDQEDEDEDEDEEEDEEEDEGGGSPISAGVMKQLRELSLLPTILRMIRSTERFPIVRRLIDASGWFSEKFKPRLTVIRENIVGAMKLVTNFPKVLLMGLSVAKEKDPKLALLIEVGATILLPFLWLFGLFFLVLRIFMRPTKILEPILGDEADELDIF